MSLTAGDRVGSYEILGLLGAGGMGEVWKARDTRLGREVAIKALPVDLLENDERKARFQREARALASLNHPGIAAIYSFEDIPGSPASSRRDLLVMELVDGESLDARISRGPLPLDEIVSIAGQIAGALAAAHENGVVHRDLKPANVMVTAEGRVKVLDFGLAKVRTPSSAPAQTEAVTEALTQAGQIFGTVPYMAPEQLRGEGVDARADIFSFGAVLYEMATGRRPFGGTSAADVVSAILKESPPPLDALRPDLPPACVRLVHRCLEKDPRRRLQSAVDLAHELHDIDEEIRTGARRALAGSAASMPATAVPAPPRSRGRGLRLAAAAVAAALVALAAFLLIPRLRRPGTEAPGPAPLKALAVLPFDNLMHDASQDYFVDGMHEALIAEIAKLGVLRVTSRTSVMQYRSEKKPLKEIARELGVDAVIEGSVLREGNRVRITAQLIRGATDEHIWAESYDRDLQDVLRLLSDVSRSIAAEVRLKVAEGRGPTPPPEVYPPPKLRPEAWEAYLRGRQILFGLTGVSKEEFLKARAEYHRAVDLDPGFARGWSGVATANLFLGFFRQAPSAEVIPIAREAALKALSLDENLGEAHGILGTIELYYDWNFPSASERLQRAVALDPHNFTTRHAWADYLMVTGRFEESLEQVKIGRSDNPTSPLAQAVVLFHTMATHRFDEVISEARRVTATFPKARMVHGLLGDALWRTGKYEDAIAEYKLQAGPDDEGVRLLEAELHRAGPKAALKAYADFFVAKAESRHPSPLGVASVCADAGETDLAFKWLEKAYYERSPQLLHVVAATEFDGLRDDPRYKDLLRRIGIPMAGS
ncbi:MAG: protein kinase domain-containing protein [Acidithiobacillales bacterium]